MATCDTNIIQVSECEDLYVSLVSYDINTEILTVRLNSGVTYTTSIPLGDVVVSAIAGNTLLKLADGLYVPATEMAINGLSYQDNDNLSVVSTDGSIDISITKVGATITADLSYDNTSDTHDPLTVVPNDAYAFDTVNQVLHIPLPTLTQTTATTFTYDANDGSGETFSFAVHPTAIVNLDLPTSWTAATQTLNLARPTLVDNGDDTYTYSAGDGTGTVFTIDVASSANICEGLANCSLSAIGDIDLTGLTTGQVIKWNGIKWVASDDNTSGGLGSVSQITDNGDGTFTHDNGNGSIKTITMPVSILLDNGDGTLTHNDGINADSTITLPVGTLVDNGNGTITYTDGVGGTYTVNLSTSTIVDNGDGTFTHTDSVLGTTVVTMPTSVVVDNGNGTYTHSNGIGDDVIIDVSASTTTNPFAAQGSPQQTRATSLPISENIYRTGATGFGVAQTEASQGQVEVRGDTYLTNAGNEERLLFQTNYGGTVDQIIQALVTLTSVYQMQFKSLAQSYYAIDEHGNTGVGEVAALQTLPDDTQGAEATVSISNRNNVFAPPVAPISVWTATDFVLVV